MIFRRRHSEANGKHRTLFSVVFSIFVWIGTMPLSLAQNDSELSDLFDKGEYGKVIAESSKAIEEGSRRQSFHELLIRSQLATGLYPEAAAALEKALETHWRPIDLRMLGYEVMRRVGEISKAEGYISEINSRYGSQPWAYRTAGDLVTLGRTAILLGADPRLVLDNLYDPAKRAEPKNRNVHLAIGELALEKGDTALAAEAFDNGLKELENDPHLLFGLARAFADSDRGKMIELLEKVLEINPKHTGSKILLSDHLIDAEDYEHATETLDEALAVNPWLPEAWALKSVISRLLNEHESAVRYRNQALHYWQTNPEVDHLIGKKLSQKYRFREGSEHQKQALAFDPDYLPAQKQLANDLLRLGEPERGWLMIEEVHAKDGYDRQAYNLVTLKDTLQDYKTLESAHFTVRVKADEAGLLGWAALNLLEEAWGALTERYQVVPEIPVFVEIFADQADFAVRTFGMPDNPGYLGVCFGPVITANSPSTQKANPSNWKAVLWHEFCHTITLHMTRNKMPRWISEGISVYEEKRAHPSWGQSMNADYVQMILEGETPGISELSAAFMTPESSRHLDFAYFISTLAVEYVVSEYGFPVLRQILTDLGEGRQMNEILASRTKPLKELDDDFKKYVKIQAESLAPELDFSKPSDGMLAVADELAQEISKPNNYWLLMKKAAALMQGVLGGEMNQSGLPVRYGIPGDSNDLAASTETNPNMEEAKALLLDLVRKYPTQTGVDSAHWLLSQVYRGEKDEEKELAILKSLASRDHDALPVYQRLMAMGTELKDWDLVLKNVERYLAVDPFSKVPYTYLLDAGEALKDHHAIIQACFGLLQLDPANPATVHYKLSKSLYRIKQPGARKHALKALEEAPRYVDAHLLLLEIHESGWEDPLVFDEETPGLSIVF